MGTLGFAAPETLRSGEYSPAADRYGFGALAYYMLTGAAPAGGPEQLIAGLRAVPLLADLPPIKLRELLSVFDEIPDRRPASAQQWIHLLRDTATTTVPPNAPRGALTWQSAPTQTPAAPQAGPESTGSRSTSSVPTMAVAAAALVVVVLLLLIWQPWAGGTSPGPSPVPAPTTEAAPAPTTSPTTTSPTTGAPVSETAVFVSRYTPKRLSVALGTCGRDAPNVDLSVPLTSSDGQADFVYYKCAGPAAIRHSTQDTDVAILTGDDRPTAEACSAAIDTSLLSDKDVVVRGGEVVCFRRTRYLVDRTGVEPLIAAITVDRVDDESLSVTAYAWNGSG